MKIGISGYVGNKLTGIGRVLIEILKELALINKDDVYVVFKNYDFDEYDLLAKLHSNIIIVNYNISKNSSVMNILWHQYGFQSQLRKFDCDLAYIPNFSLLLWKIKPTIVTIHDLIEYNVPNKFSKLRMVYRKIIDPLMAKNSTFVTTVSECSKSDIIKYCGSNEEKIQVIPNAADRTKFKRYSSQIIDKILIKYGLKRESYILFVGTIDYPGKNIKTCLEAYLNLKKKYSITEKLVIVGKDGYNAKMIYNYVNDSIYVNDVIFTGYVSDDDLAMLYAGAKVMLYLSLYEGFGLPVLEAMSCGTAVLCSNTSCFSEVVGNVDVCVPPNDILEIEKKIYQMIVDDNYRIEIANTCYLRADKYSWKKSANIYYDVFKNILNRNVLK